MNFILIGFMGCGKSTVGQALAEILHAGYHDLDRMIEQNNGMTIPDIFATKGEDFFRQSEREALFGALQTGGILATGGGTPMMTDNQVILKQTSTPIIWLDADINTVMNRVGQQTNRPLVKKLGRDGLADLKRQREFTYSLVADIKISTDGKTPEAIATEIIHQMGAKVSND
ncbi:shikimate kinase [Lentilactobacillus sp. Marseille-Q4993]|uniref:shikimate kinase n=1 Tax=Lentilactobacillus sp. Marseille-Q4993 TaxID=3039492 RepID=UPI0024BC7A22|nr:shikimate kinase [Lentilactobacillus sp. Marseille-Q4993]